MKTKTNQGNNMDNQVTTQEDFDEAQKNAKAFMHQIDMQMQALTQQLINARNLLIDNGFTVKHKNDN